MSLNSETLPQRFLAAHRNGEGGCAELLSSGHLNELKGCAAGLQLILRLIKYPNSNGLQPRSDGLQPN